MLMPMMEPQAFGSMLTAHSVVYRRFSYRFFVFVVVVMVVARPMSIVLRSLREQPNATTIILRNEFEEETAMRSRQSLMHAR